nr:integrase, catalytic region, zinc finger, CCHC-type, peptidase aspartic, catalytic [Tanacetum cinerariifolium]
MSTQQDIYASGSESRPPMLNKENYVAWSSRLLRYAKSRQNGKLIHNSILNGPYVRRMILKPGDANREITVTETFHLQTDDELSDKELKQIEADDQAIQTILLGLPEDIYAAVDSCETAQEIRLRRISSNPRNMQIAQPGMNMGQDRQMQIVRGNGGNQFRQYAGQNAGNPAGYNDVIGNQVIQNAVQNPRVQNAGNQNGLIGVQGNGNQNQIENGNLVAAHAEGYAARQNGNQIRCYNCRGVEEYDLMAAAADLDKIEEVNANCILMANLQQASTSDTQTDRAPVYDTNGSAENLAIEVEKVNTVNRKLKETNADLTTELARFKNQERCFEISQEKNDKLERCYQQSVYQEQCLSKKINALHLSTANVSKSFSMPNEDLLDDTTPNVARKFLNEVKSIIVTLQHVVKQRMTIETHNWASSAHQELHKIPNLLETFNLLQKKLMILLLSTRHWNLEIERLLKAVVSQDIISVVQNASVVDSSVLQTELERTKERFKNCIIKKENEYAKLWNDCTIYKNAKLRTQLFKKVSDQKNNTRDTSANTKFAKQPIVENLPNVGETHALSKPVTSNSVSTPQESKGVNNDKVISPGMFRINPSKTSREDKHVPNTVSASTRTKLITVSQPPVITEKNVNSNLNCLSSTGVDNTKTRRPQPRSNTKHDRVFSASKSRRSKKKEAEVKEHHRNLLLSKNNKHISSACNNIKTDSHDVISKKFYAMCNKCLISVNHDKCLHNYVNGKNSRGKKQKAKVSVKEIQKKYQPKDPKPKKVGTLERLATPKPRKPRFLLRWSPTGRLFDQEGKLVASSNSKSQYDCSNGDNACASNAMEPKIKQYPNSASLLDRNDHVAAILGFGDLQWGNILITRVYFIEGLGHNLFSVRQFYDSDLEVAFRRNACFVRNLKGVDLLKRDRSTNLYTINLHEMASASPIYLMARASSTKSWLWHQRLSHLNFDTINDLARNDLVAGLPKFKYHKEHLFPSCEQGKKQKSISSTKTSSKFKAEVTSSSYGF